MATCTTDENHNKCIPCNHTMIALTKIETNEYFTEEYVQKKMEDPDCFYASVCNECGGHVRDKLPSNELSLNMRLV